MTNNSIHPDYYIIINSKHHDKEKIKKIINEKNNDFFNTPFKYKTNEKNNEENDEENDEENFNIILCHSVKYSNTTCSIETIEFILEKMKCEKYYSFLISNALIIAIMFLNNTSSIETVQLLLKKGAVINYNYFNVRHANLNDVDTNDVDTNDILNKPENCTSTTPLISAIKSEANIQFLKFLIANDADVNFCNDKLTSPLIIATSQYNLDAIKLLINNGASINHKNIYGHSALYLCVAMYNKNVSFDIFNYLVKSGADVNATNDNGISIYFE